VYAIYHISGTKEFDMSQFEAANWQVSAFAAKALHFEDLSVPAQSKIAN
jgi:hypothetical protein|tara:strand:+ start:1289 stop:1435 length:147 start_codon:yes stop_codon:yes gene_type:complete